MRSVFIVLTDIIIKADCISGWAYQDIPKDNLNPEYYVIYIYRDGVEHPITLTYLTADARDKDVRLLNSALLESEIVQG